jgi:hypothetical protein
MGYNLAVIINFGVAFDEDQEFPWNDDFEGWWFDICGSEKLPCPVEIDYYGIDERLCVSLYVPGTKSSGYDYPIDVEQSLKKKVSEEDVTKFEVFLEKYGLDTEGDPAWLAYSVYF